MLKDMEQQLSRLEDEQNSLDPNMIRLVVKGSLDQQYYVWVDRTTTIKDLKPMLHIHSGIPPAFQKLMTDTSLNLTDDNKSLQSYGLVSENIIHILFPFRSSTK